MSDETKWYQVWSILKTKEGFEWLIQEAPPTSSEQEARATLTRLPMPNYYIPWYAEEVQLRIRQLWPRLLHDFPV